MYRRLSELQGALKGYVYFYRWKRKRTPSIGNRSFVHHRILSAVKRVEFITDRMSYIVLRGSWCYIVLNEPATNEKKSDDSKDSFMRT